MVYFRTFFTVCLNEFFAPFNRIGHCSISFTNIGLYAIPGFHHTHAERTSYRNLVGYDKYGISIGRVRKENEMSRMRDKYGAVHNIRCCSVCNQQLTKVNPKQYIQCCLYWMYTVYHCRYSIIAALLLLLLLLLCCVYVRSTQVGVRNRELLIITIITMRHSVYSAIYRYILNPPVVSADILVSWTTHTHARTQSRTYVRCRRQRKRNTYTYGSSFTRQTHLPNE